MRGSRLSIGIAITCAVACTPASGGQQQPGDDDVSPSGDGGSIAPVPTCKTDVASALAGMKVPGASAGIIKNGKLVCTVVAGNANIEQARPVTPDTVFAWASVSKTVTATAAMILFDEGKFGLDDDIKAHLPFAARNPNCSSRPITFRQLLTHTSSIVDNTTVYNASYVIGDSPIALGDFVRGYIVSGGAYFNANDNFDSGCPGTVNDYSNVAVGLLGYVVERISGKPFHEFCRERIFAPLGMTETSFRLADLDVNHIAMPYDGATSFTAHGHIGFPTYPDGLLRTSVPQLARFLAMMPQRGQYNGTRILAESTVTEMARAQIPALDDTQGLIWYFEAYPARPHLLGHTGEDPGTSSKSFYDPATGEGVLLVANGSWYDGNGDSPAADTLFGKLFAEAATF